MHLSHAYRPNLGKILLTKYTKGDLAYNDDIPSISLVRATYGESSACEWIVTHLFDLLNYTEQEIGVADSCIYEFAELLMAKYYYLNLADIMYFCAECKLGKYGKFYGVTGPSQLAEMFAKYIQERNNEIDAVERRKQQERMARQDYLINGYHEYLAKLKEKAQAGDEEAAETLRRHGE